MEKQKIQGASWYSNAVAICIGVVLYILLSQFSSIWASILVFFGYFRPLIMGAAIAYIVNPMAVLFERFLGFITKARVRRTISIGAACIVVVFFLLLAVSIFIPQLIKSADTFLRNFDGYRASVMRMIKTWGLSHPELDLSSLISSSDTLLTTLSEHVLKNVGNIVSVSASAGKGLFQWLIAFILAIYLLAEKLNLKAGARRLIRALFGEKHYPAIRVFILKCDSICNQYIVYNLVDSLIVGVSNALFMSISGMQYVGMISCIVGAANLVPTFGPMIGLVFGAFILLMTNPVHSLFFVIFTLILQTVDGYVIKPRLFGDSLGISGLWILIAVIVGGNMFGVLGILMGVPIIAILDFIYRVYFIPALEKRGPILPH